MSSRDVFPSDHAVLFFALATGLFMAHRKLGIAAYAWVIVAICFPRLYLGIHWPTDVIAGAAVGVALGWAGTTRAIRDAIRTHILPWSESWPGFFYAGMFLIMFEVMNIFDDARAGLHVLSHGAKNVL